MIPLIRPSNLFFSSPPHSLPNSSPSSSSFSCRLIHPRRQPLSLSFNLLVQKPNDSLGFSCLGSSVLLLHRGSCSGSGSGFVRIKSKGWENEGDPALEREILEFMKSSKNPNAFPTKKDFIDAGRMDLVEAIQKQRGWLCLGWDFDEEETVQENELLGLDSRRNGEDFDVDLMENDCRIFQQRFDNGGKSRSLEGIEAGTSGRSMRIEGEEKEAAGIEGILSRLEKERNLSYGFGTKQKESTGRAKKNDGGDDDWQQEASMAAEDGKHGVTEDMMVPRNVKTVNSGSEQIKSRLQHLELELSSALRVLSLKNESTDIVVSNMGSGKSSEELHELSDAWEFQETEIMNARDRLRSTRAKLAILEGKMSLALIEARKITEVKQKRINDARKALYLLRTTCIVWPNSASEVLLTGSFDGWASQRKMERSSSGIFSLCLKLYPGQYEFKFIVDGVWKIDPLRPIVCNNGHENNLLIIS